MKSILCYFICICTLAGFVSCITDRNVSIPYTIADNYFVRNDVKNFEPRKIENERDLLKIFGMATTMNSFPSSIDFTRQYALAVMDSSTNVLTEIKPVSLKKGKGGIEFRYKIMRKGNPQSYYMVPCLLIIVDRKNGNSIRFIRS